jgi:TPR repeat protein
MQYPDEFRRVDELLGESRFAEAAAVARPLAEAGVAWAQGSLGSLHIGGFGVPQDNDLAIYWLKLAASQDDGLSCHSLSTLYAVAGQPEDSEYWRAQAHRLGWDLLTQPWPPPQC